jgi:hypothetical protein
VHWIDLPFEERPQLLMGSSLSIFLVKYILHIPTAYEPSLDQAGHKAGPYSALVNVSQALIFN